MWKLQPSWFQIPDPPADPHAVFLCLYLTPTTCKLISITSASTHIRTHHIAIFTAKKESPCTSWYTSEYYTKLKCWHCWTRGRTQGRAGGSVLTSARMWLKHNDASPKYNNSYSVNTALQHIIGSSHKSLLHVTIEVWVISRVPIRELYKISVTTRNHCLC